jgi:hypothetical protein
MLVSAVKRDVMPSLFPGKYRPKIECIIGIFMKPEYFERECFERIAGIVKPYSEMEENEKFFLSGLIRLFRPVKILELGVSSG